jgi:hypothetical protein
MKKSILFTVLMASFSVSSQSLTQANEASVGENLIMYVCDSIDDYSNNQGTGVTWDYSNLVGIAGQTRVVSIDDPASTVNTSSFPTSTFAISAGSLLASYYTSTSTQRMSQGFVFSEPTLGDVVVKFDTDEAKVMDYPFSNGSMVTDNFEGQLNFTLSGIPQISALTGTVYSSIDGQGTLVLPGLTTIADVIRYKIIDTTYTDIIILGGIEIIRIQYEYYDITNTSLPIFSHTTLIAKQTGSSSPISTQTLVLSSIETDEFLAVNKINKLEVSVYPNPTDNEIKLNGNFSPNAIATIYDQSAHIMISTNLSNESILNTSSLDTGIYMVKIQDNEETATIKIVKN